MVAALSADDTAKNKMKAYEEVVKMADVQALLTALFNSDIKIRNNIVCLQERSDRRVFQFLREFL